MRLLRLANIKIFLIVVPFIFYALNVQAFLLMYVSETASQASAYLMFGHGILAFALMLITEPREKKPLIIRVWYLFFAAYYVIGFTANALNNYEAPFLKTLIPFFFFLAFSEFFSSEKRARLILKLSTIIYSIANIALIVFYKINYSLDHNGIYAYELNRAGGVYGDANNAALVCLLTFVLFRNIWKPKTILLKSIKITGMIVALYALLLAFSKTGMVIFLLILIIQQMERMNPKRIIGLFVVTPLLLISLVQVGLNSNILTDDQKIRLENVVNIVTLNVDKVDSSHRDVLLYNMFEYIFQNPILGNGIYLSTEIRGHNTIFGVWADAGILTFIIFLSILFLYIHKSIIARPKIRVLGLSLSAILILYMLTLQTVIDQVYLLPFFVYLCYLLEAKEYYGEDFKIAV